MADKTPITPTVDQVRHAWILSRWESAKQLRSEGSDDEFDRFLIAYETQLREGIAKQIRQNCTPSSTAYTAGGDTLIYAVADWVKEPPGWVGLVSPTLAQGDVRALQDTNFAQKKRIEELKARVEFLEQQEEGLRHDVGLLDLISGIINSTDPAKAVRIQEILDEGSVGKS